MPHTCSTLGVRISIHALREEGDHVADTICSEWLEYFYPRPPRGGRRRRVLVDVPDGNDFYPRSPRGGRHKHYIIILSDSSISIHALREEGDR